MGILNSIKQKTDKQKKIFSVIVAGVLTLIIVSVYFSFTGTNNQIVEDESNKLSSVKPLQMIKDEFSKAFSSSEEIGSSTIPIEIIEATTTN